MMTSAIRGACLAMLATAVVVVGGCESTTTTEEDDEPTTQEVADALDDANYCAVAADCADLGSWCPFGCPVLVNEAEEDSILALLNAYDSDCVSSCPSYGAIDCQAGQCVALPY